MPCVKGMPVRVDDQVGSGCRVDCLHRRSVMDYQLARLSYEQQREDVTIGYATETVEYHRDVGTFTFRDWLLQTARSFRQAAS